jgi:hypothetical protein
MMSNNNNVISDDLTVEALTNELSGASLGTFQETLKSVFLRVIPHFPIIFIAFIAFIIAPSQLVV